MANAARVTYPAALQRCKFDAPLLAAGLLAFADFDECFIVVNVTHGSENGGTKEQLQELADRIDFRIQKDVQVPDMQGDSEVPVELEVNNHEKILAWSCIVFIYQCVWMQ